MISEHNKGNPYFWQLEDELKKSDGARTCLSVNDREFVLFQEKSVEPKCFESSCGLTISVCWKDNSGVKVANRVKGDNVGMGNSLKNQGNTYSPRKA